MTFVWNIVWCHHDVMHTWMPLEKASSAVYKYNQELKRSLLSHTVLSTELSWLFTNSVSFFLQGHGHMWHFVWAEPNINKQKLLSLLIWFGWSLTSHHGLNEGIKCVFPTLLLIPDCGRFCSIFECVKQRSKSPLHDCCTVTDLGFFPPRDNATDAQVCSGLGTCLCGDCVCKKTEVSAVMQWVKYSVLGKWLKLLNMYSDRTDHSLKQRLWSLYVRPLLRQHVPS